MKYKETHQNILEVLKKMGHDAPEMMVNFGGLHKSAMKDNALPNKQKELIALGISITIQCNECISYHMNDSVAAGATRDEILETISVAVMMGGGPALMYATHAYEAMLEFIPE